MSWNCGKCNAHWDDKISECLLCLEAEVHAPDNDKWTKLYHAVNLMMCKMGAEGDVNTRQKVSMDVMDALFEIDGGVYDEKLKLELMK